MDDRWYVDEERACCFIRYRTAEEVLEALRRLAEDPALLGLSRRVHDLRGIRREVGTEEVLDLSRAAASLWSGRAPGSAPARVAVLVEGDLTYGLVRMFESYAESMMQAHGIAGPELRVVRTFRAAVEWVGLPADYRDPFDSRDLEGTGTGP